MNGIRGETGIEIDGVTRRLCLTLGALAEIETAFGCKSLGELQARLRVLSAGEMLTVLAALLRGGGEADTLEMLPMQTVAPGAAARAIGEAFHAALG
jgi:hypothetical protein